jgi:hypothetical protein
MHGLWSRQPAGRTHTMHVLGRGAWLRAAQAARSNARRSCMAVLCVWLDGSVWQHHEKKDEHAPAIPASCLERRVGVDPGSFLTLSHVLPLPASDSAMGRSTHRVGHWRDTTLYDPMAVQTVGMSPLTPGDTDHTLYHFVWGARSIV